jgi:hypothetical protein
VHSKPGEGSTFFAVLPRAARTGPASGDGAVIPGAGQGVGVPVRT